MEQCSRIAWLLAVWLVGIGVVDGEAGSSDAIAQTNRCSGNARATPHHNSPIANANAMISRYSAQIRTRPPKARSLPGTPYCPITRKLDSNSLPICRFPNSDLTIHQLPAIHFGKALIPLPMLEHFQSHTLQIPPCHTNSKEHGQEKPQKRWEPLEEQQLSI